MGPVIARGKAGTNEDAADLEWRSAVQLRLSSTLEAALDAFSERGYDGTTVRDIARRVGVTVPALYYHHENKESMLFALLETTIDRLHSLCQAALDEAQDEVSQRFLNLVEAITLYMAHSTKMARLDAEIRSLSPENRARYSAKRRKIEQMLVDVIDEGRNVEDFDVTSPHDAARALLGMLQAIPMWYRPDGKTTPRDLARIYADIAAHAVGAGPDVVRRARELT